MSARFPVRREFLRADPRVTVARATLGLTFSFPGDELEAGLIFRALLAAGERLAPDLHASAAEATTLTEAAAIARERD